MIKGILFDKDGTLIDFFSLWMGAAKAVVIQFLKENELSEEVKERVFYAMGIENGEIDPYGGLAYKSYSEIALDITDELSREQIYLDSFLKVSKLEDADVTDTLDQLDKIGEKYGISIVVSISLDKEEIPEALQDKIAVAL